MATPMATGSAKMPTRAETRGQWRSPGEEGEREAGESQNRACHQPLQLLAALPGGMPEGERLTGQRGEPAGRQDREEDPLHEVEPAGRGVGPAQQEQVPAGIDPRVVTGDGAYREDEGAGDPAQAHHGVGLRQPPSPRRGQPAVGKQQDH